MSKPTPALSIEEQQQQQAEADQKDSKPTSLMITTLLLTLAIFCLPLYLLYKPPAFLIHYLQHHYPDILWEVRPNPGPNSKQKQQARNQIALTIDDTPSTQTREILRILAAHKAHATFFVIGSQIPGNEDILREAVRAGHELGNHAMFDEPSWKLSEEKLRGEILEVQRRIEAIYNSAFTSASASGVQTTRKPPRYFRPGSGLFTTRMRGLVRELGFRIVLGGVYPHDPQIRYWRVNARHVLSLARPGAIVIVHDGEGRSWTGPMLRRVLGRVRERGMDVGSVGELLESE